MTLPNDFIISMQQMLGNDFPNFETTLHQKATVSIRKNLSKSHHYGMGSICFEEESPVGWCDSGYYLPHRPVFTYDPLFHAGAYYVQEASSMFLAHLLKEILPSHPVIALDLCAAPGGKSTLLLSELPAESLLFANEIVRQRSHILRENIIKWGNPSVVVTNNTPEDYRRSGLTFDLVLCDAPCSGEGLFRKTPDAIGEWSKENVAFCGKRQQDILMEGWACLSPGGILIYSTCTYNIIEDEGNARFIRDVLGGQPLTVEVDPTWGVDTNNYADDDIPVYHFFPHKAMGEGFFICAFRKPYDNKTSTVSPTLKPKQPKQQRVPKEMSTWITTSGYGIQMELSGDIFAVPLQHSYLIDYASTKLKVIHKGIHLASPKGKSYKPEQSLAMSNLLNRTAFHCLELCKEEALSYLRCESLSLPNCPRGFVLVTYKGYALGFVNNVGNRANNLYPNEWRIRN